MEKDNRKPVIDFSSYIIERTERFTGREWVFQAVNGWLADTNGSRFLLLTGEPGSGKTAIASRLSQFAHGTVPQPDGLMQLTRDFLSAIHFCSARDRRWINPHVFAESLAMQLAERYPSYAKSLVEESGDRQVVIEVAQRVQEVREGQVIGVVINRLDVSGVLPEDAFSRIVREPLEALFHDEFDQQVVIIVDALDEALRYSGNVSIISLLDQANNLPPRVRFLLTSRQDERVENKFLDADRIQISAGEFDQRNQEDIRRYVKGRLEDDLALAGQAAHLPTARVTELVEAITRKAEGNFLYVRFLLDAMARGQRPLTEIDSLPEGLDSLYFDSLQRVVELGKRDWSDVYAPLMGVLSVAQESLTLSQLMMFTKDSKTAVWRNIGDLQQFIEEVDPKEEEDKGTEKRYRLYHQSVIDFFHRQSLGVEMKQLRNSYFLPADEWHTKIVNHYRAGTVSWEVVDWSRIDGYGLRHLTHHLFSSEENQQLLDLLRSPFLAAKAQQLGSYRSILDDLLLGAQAAMRQSNFPVLLHFMLVYVGLKQRISNLPVEEIIPLYAAAGQVNRAVELAKLIDTDWVRRRTMRAIVDSLIQHDRNKALEVAKLIDDPEYRAEAYTNILQDVLTEGEAMTDFSSLLDDALDLVEHSRDPYWQSHKLWLLAEIVRPIDYERAALLIEQAITAARTIYRDQWRYEELRRLAQTVSKQDKARGIQLYQEAIAAIERTDESEWKAEWIGETFGELVTLDGELAVTLAGELQSIVGKPFALAHLAAYFSQHDQPRAISLVQQSLHAADSIQRIRYPDIRSWLPRDWYEKAKAAIAWAMARYDLEAALALVEDSDGRDAALIQIAHDLANVPQQALRVANGIQSLETRSQVLADLVSSQLEKDTESNMAIINQIPEPMQRCRALTDAGTWLLSHADKRGASFIDQAIDLASSQADKEAVLLADIATRLRIQDRKRSVEMRQRAVESALASWDTDQSFKVLIQVANLYIQEGNAVSALALIRKAAQYSRSDIYDQGWFIDSQAVLFRELARYNLEGAFTLIDSLPAPVQAFMLPGVIDALAQTDLDQALKLAEQIPNHSTLSHSRDLAVTRCEGLASILLAAANQGSPETMGLAELLLRCNSEHSLIDLKCITIARASGAVARYNLRIAQHLLNKIMTEPYDFIRHITYEEEMRSVGDALIGIAQNNRRVAMRLIPKVMSAYMASGVGDEEEKVSVTCEEIARFAPVTALALLKRVTVDPGYRSKVLSSVALSVAKQDQAKATSFLNRSIKEAKRSQWEWLTIEALLVATLRVMQWDRSKMQILIGQAIDLTRETQNTLSRGENLAQAARVLLLADRVDQAIPLLRESIELMRFDAPGMLRIDVLKAITEAFDVCSREVLTQLLPKLFYTTLEAEDLLFKGMPLILPSIWRSSTADISETLRTMIREIETAVQVIQEVFTG